MDLLDGVFIIVVLTLAVSCVTLGLLLAHIYAGRRRTKPPADKAPNPAAAEQGGAAKKHCFDKDREYFIKLGRTVRDKWKETIILSVGVVSLSVVLLLKIFAGLICDQLLPVLCAIIVFLMFLAWGIFIKRPKVKVKKTAEPHKFNPVSLGILYFSFALAVWTNKTTDDWQTYSITIGASIISAVFFIGVYAKPVRTFINKHAAPIVLPLTTIALLFTFMFDWIPAYKLSPSISLYVILYFGFLWLVNYLLVMYRDVAWEPVRVLLMFFFIVAASIEFNFHNDVGYIGGATLLFITGLMYCVAVGHITPYGTLED